MQKDEWIKPSVRDWHFAWRIERRSMTPRFQIGSEKSLIFCENVWGFFPESGIETYNFHRRTFLVEVVFHDVRELPDGLERLADLQFKESIEYCLLYIWSQY